MISVPMRNGWYIFDMISHFVRWYIPSEYEGTDIISYFRKAEIYHAAKPYIISRKRYIIPLLVEKDILCFRHIITFLKVHNPIWHFQKLKVSFSLYVEKTETTSLRSVSAWLAFLLSFNLIIHINRLNP